MADTLEVQDSARLKLTRNGIVLYDQNFVSTAQTYTVHAADRVVLATNMSSFQQASLGDLGASTPAEFLMVVSDQAITIGVSSTTATISADLLLMQGASVTQLHFKNTDANNTATVEFVATD